MNVEDTTPILPNLRFGSQPFKQFSRLTALLEDQAQLNSMVNNSGTHLLLSSFQLNPKYKKTSTSPIIGSYDIFAVQPTTEKLFHQ